MQDPKYPSILISNEGDQADSANHTTYYKLMQLILGEEHEDTRYLYFQRTTGKGRRHPDRETSSFTRDQFTPFIAYAAITKYHNKYKNLVSGWLYSQLLVETFYQLVKDNSGFFFNTIRSNGEKKAWYEVDWLDPQTRALYARASGGPRWMHYLGDVNLLLTILHKDTFKPEHNQDENIHCHLIVARLVQPTFIGNYAWKYYFTKTKKNWKQKLVDFFDRGGTYYPEIPPIAIKAMEKLNLEQT